MATRAYAPAPLDMVLSALPGLPRAVLSRLVTRAIERLDEIDGDPDLEATGDEGDPDFRKRRRYRRNGAGPGCVISDPDFGAEEIGEIEDCI